MATRANHPKRLLVEGQDDKHSVIHLMRARIPEWPQGEEKAQVWVDIGYGAEQILKAGFLTARLKESRLEALGVVLDADEHAPGRYQRVRELCHRLHPDLPEQLRPEGVVVENSDRQRFGVWIMPDNVSPGTLEVFLHYLVPQERQPLWNLACSAVQTARSQGAPVRECHEPKANLYTWLAWQDEPGYSPGIALTRRILDPGAAYADAFVAWFRELYRI